MKNDVLEAKCKDIIAGLYITKNSRMRVDEIEFLNHNFSHKSCFFRSLGLSHCMLKFKSSRMNPLNSSIMDIELNFDLKIIF